MAVTFVGAGTWTNQNTSTVSPTFHASTAVGDMVVVLWVGKADALVGGVIPTPATPSGWTAGATGVTGATASTTSGTGSLRCISFYKQYASGDGTSMSINYTQSDPQSAIAFTFRQAGSGWSVATTALVDTSATGTAISATGTRIDVDNGDRVCLMGGLRTASETVTSPNLATPGTTYGTQTPYTANSNTNGSDMSTFHSTFAATAGADTGASTFTGTASISASSETAIALVRVRQVGADLPPPTGVDSVGVLIG